MLMIRLFRIGRKNQPAYKVVVTEKTNPPARGRFVEEVGFYNPLTKEKDLNAERIRYWISVGAQPSDTIHNMLVKEKIVEGDIIPKQKKAKEKKEEKPEAAAPTEQGSEEKTEEAPTTEVKTEEKTETQEEKSVEPEKSEEPASEPEVKEEAPVEKKEESKDSKEPPKEEKTE